MNKADEAELPEKGIWKMVATPDHQMYYFHTKTKETKWELAQEEIDEMLEGEGGRWGRGGLGICMISIDGFELLS